MGFDATYYCPVNISKNKLVDYLKLLRYEGSGNEYYFYSEDEYKYLYGVAAYISENDNQISVWLRTSIFCNYFDLEFMNSTLRQLKRCFGGSFISDEGKNRYFTKKYKQNSPAERGCYAARFRLDNEFASLRFLILKYPDTDPSDKALEHIGVSSNASLLANISLTYASSIIENYFRELYIALLRYSDKKEKIINSTRFNNFDLFEVSEKKASIEQAVAFSKSFQNINKINIHFKELDSRIDIYGILSKPYRNRKETLFQAIDRVLEQRHALVHRLSVETRYKQQEALKDIQSIEIALDKIYEHICSVNNWPPLKDL